MKYAIISDIHGNYPAFMSVIEDAKSQAVDAYILLGDYTYRYPWANEIVEDLRRLESAHIIRGNGEGYLSALRDKSKSDMTDEQSKPLYWVLHALTPKNLEYLTNLPETMAISHDGVDIHIAHSMDLFYQPSVIEFFHTINFNKMMMRTPISHEEYLARGQKALLECPVALAEINALPKGVYLFGHNHLQFNMFYEGRYFINPGSCGMAADWDATAAYSILDCAYGACTVLERRVKYDLSIVAKELVTSSFYDYAPAWSDIIKAQLLTGKEYFGFFVNHVNETGARLGQTTYPVSNEAWDIAVKTWDMDNLRGE